MNKLLHVNKSLLLFILLGTFLILIITIISKNTYISVNKIADKSKGPNFDIINPSFIINNKQKISVKKFFQN